MCSISMESHRPIPGVLEVGVGGVGWGGTCLFFFSLTPIKMHSQGTILLWIMVIQKEIRRIGLVSAIS